MKNYLVHESNMERLDKKMASLKKKCAQSNCSFTYNVVGEQFIEQETSCGEKYFAKYFEVEVDGEAKYNGWRFIATLDHHSEGNVVRAYDTEITIPDRFKTCGPTCEHCNMIRSRKDTYLIYNEEKDEFKQVGKSCLMEFTGGLSAENIAFFCSIYEAAETSREYHGPNFNRYIPVRTILQYAFECYKHWGYQKSTNSFYDEEIPAGYRSTSERVIDYFYINRVSGKFREQLRSEMDSVGFNADSEYAVSSTEAALEWIKNEKDFSSEYIRNLHIICSDEYTDYRSLGILVSLTIAYNRHLDNVAAYEKKQKAHEAEVKSSDYVGEVGQRIDINVTSATCVSSWDTYFGTTTYLYKFTDADDNVLVWFASGSIEDTSRVVSIKGTVKEHSEFNGIKQTVLTRCKVTLSPEAEKEENIKPATNEVQKALDAFFEFVNAD